MVSIRRRLQAQREKFFVFLLSFMRGAISLSFMRGAKLQEKEMRITT